MSPLWITVLVEILGIIGSIVVCVIPILNQNKKDRLKAANETAKQTDILKAEIKANREYAEQRDIELSNRIDTLALTVEESKAVEARVRIITFDNELTQNIDHSYAQFQQAMLDVDYYMRFCEDHTNFTNGIASAACNRIRKEYERMRETNKI